LDTPVGPLPGEPESALLEAVNPFGGDDVARRQGNLCLTKNTCGSAGSLPLSLSSEPYCRRDQPCSGPVRRYRGAAAREEGNLARYLIAAPFITLALGPAGTRRLHGSFERKRIGGPEPLMSSRPRPE
jgi:hypothetical protein